MRALWASTILSGMAARGPRLLAQLTSPHRLFLVVSILAGLPLVVLTPPFQAPDEPAHFLRAFALSRGQPWPEVRGEAAGSVLPGELASLVDLTTDLPRRPESRFELSTLETAWRLRFGTEAERFQPYTHTAVYSPVPYLPQALGVLAGRMLSERPIVAFYLGRLANLVVAVALISWALRLAPAYRWPLTLLALAPMALFLRSSMSADSLTAALAFVLSATVARLALSRPDGARGDGAAHGERWLLMVCAPLLALTKIPYVFLALAAAAIPPAGWALLGRGQRRTRRLAAGYALLCIAAAVLSLLLAHRIDIPMRAGPDIATWEQVAYALEHPATVSKVIVGDWASRAPRYAAELIGRLGWLEVGLPPAFYAAFILAFIALLMADTRSELRISPVQRLVFALAALGSAFLVSAAQYATWTPVAASEVIGTQGRYFYPSAVMAVWVVLAVRPPLGRGRSLALVGVTAAGLSAATTLVAVWSRYYS